MTAIGVCMIQVLWWVHGHACIQHRVMRRLGSTIQQNLASNLWCGAACACLNVAALVQQL